MYISMLRRGGAGEGETASRTAMCGFAATRRRGGFLWGRGSVAAARGASRAGGWRARYIASADRHLGFAPARRRARARAPGRAIERVAARATSRDVN